MFPRAGWLTAAFHVQEVFFIDLCDLFSQVGDALLDGSWHAPSDTPSFSRMKVPQEGLQSQRAEEDSSMLGIMYTISRRKIGGLCLKCKDCSHIERASALMTASLAVGSRPLVLCVAAMPSEKVSVRLLAYIRALSPRGQAIGHQ
jgi:hypothetical protein